MNFSFNLKKNRLLYSVIFLFLFQVGITFLAHQQFLNSFVEQVADKFSTSHNEALLNGDSLGMAKEISAIVGNDYIRCASVFSQSQDLFRYKKSEPCELLFLVKRKKFISPSGDLDVTLDLQLPPKMQIMFFLLIALEVGLVLAAGVLIKRFKEREFQEVVKYSYLAAKAAHDIRSPLSALSVISATLPDSSGAHKELLKSAVERISGISKELYDLSKVQFNVEKSESKAATSLVKKDKTDIIAIVRQAVEEAKLTSGTRVSFLIQTNREVQVVSLDVQGIRRVLANLFNNSIEAQGQDELRINIQILANDLKTVITIQDNGVGIPSDILKKIGRTRVSHGKSTKSDSGTGLGLKSAFEYMEQMSGNIGINSKVGSGTVVSLEFSNNI